MQKGLNFEDQLSIYFQKLCFMRSSFFPPLAFSKFQEHFVVFPTF